MWLFNTLGPRRNGRHFPDDIFECIFFNENVWILLRISLKFVPNIWINNIPALVQIMLNQLWFVYWRIYASLGLNESTMLVKVHTDQCRIRYKSTLMDTKLFSLIKCLCIATNRFVGNPANMQEMTFKSFISCYNTAKYEKNILIAWQGLLLENDIILHWKDTCTDCFFFITHIPPGSLRL